MELVGLTGYDSYGGGGGGYDSYGGGGGDHGFYGEQVQHQYAPAVPVSEHVEITKPIPIPVVKNVGKFDQSIQTSAFILKFTYLLYKPAIFP